MKKLLIITFLIVFIFGVGSLIIIDKNNTIPILAYHMVDDINDIYCIKPEKFEEQIKYLKEEGYTSVSLEDMTDGLEGKITLPSKPIVITFDDGYKDNYTIAMPILKKYGMKATIFVIVNSVGQANYLSWDEIKALQQEGFEIGSHTLNHVALKEKSDEDIIKEIELSKKIIEEKTNKPANFLAYPFGSHTKQMEKLLKKYNYKGACTGIDGLNESYISKYFLRRVSIAPNPKYGIYTFKVKLFRAYVKHAIDHIKTNILHITK